MEPNEPHKSFLPLINRGTYTRIYAINSNIKAILNNTPKTENINIIILGSGFDTLYFNLKNEGHNNITVYELDYDKIISKKKKLIDQSNKLKPLIDEEHYKLISCDITSISKLKKKLEENIPQDKKDDLSIIICECILVYIDREKTVEILSTLYNKLKNSIILEFDLIGANDGFGKEMVMNLSTRNIQLKGFEGVPDIKAQIERLQEVGYKEVEFVDMKTVYNKFLSPEERNRINKLEMMDEFEEFDLLQTHACYGYGIQVEEKYKELKKVLKFK